MRRPPNIPRRVQTAALLGERSGLTSPREPNSLYRAWSFTQDASEGATDSSGLGRALGSRISGFVPRGTTARMHPFKIYQVPVGFRNLSGDPNNYTTLTQAKWWRCFRVRAGWVMGAAATATDAEDANPDMDTYPPTYTDILVPDSTPIFYFWVELGTDISGHPTGVVRWGLLADAIAGSFTSSEYTANNWTSTLPWAGAPWPDGGHITIGTVDTNTFHSSSFAQVRQYLRTDIISAGSLCPAG